MHEKIEKEGWKDSKQIICNQNNTKGLAFSSKVKKRNIAGKT